MKTAIKTASGYQAVESHPIEIQGLKLVTHKSPSEKPCGWCYAVSDPATGLALARSSTKAGAVNLAHERVVRAGAWQVQAKLNAEIKAPAVEGLPVWSPPVKPEPVKADIGSIVDLVAKTVGGLSDKERAAVRAALNSRTGQLKAKSPSSFGDESEQLACAAWNGLQPNAFKIKFSACFLRGEAAVLLDKLSKVQWPAAFDKDKHALVNAGVW